MVLVKANLGQETRKFPLESDATIQDLTSKLLELFPALKGRSATDIELLYRDDDGDVITVSSDEELQTALQHSTDNNITFMIRVTATPQENGEDNSFGLEDLVDCFFHHRPFHSAPFHGSFHPFEHSVFGSHFPFGYGTGWHERRRQLRIQEEKLRQQRLYEEKMRQARLEQLKAMREKARKEQEEMRKKATESGASAVQQKKQPPLIPEFPAGWTVMPIGTWGPAVHHGPGYTVHSWGPWGYRATFDNTSDKKEKGDEPPEDGANKDEPPEDGANEESQ